MKEVWLSFLVWHLLTPIYTPPNIPYYLHTYLLHPHPYSVKEIRRAIFWYSCPKALAMLLMIRWAWAPCWAWASWAWASSTWFPSTNLDWNFFYYIVGPTRWGGRIVKFGLISAVTFALGERFSLWFAVRVRFGVYFACITKPSMVSFRLHNYRWNLFGKTCQNVWL